FCTTFKSISKILRLIVLYSNLKSNLQISASNLSHRNPYPENAKFKAPIQRNQSCNLKFN
ncbi:hypothetical protein, partial [Campylobacter showae]|uniref:hypothetical protein n=1 Tax=Campylobacter showae TaxID=204 RepID=UPI001E34E6ED